MVTRISPDTCFHSLNWTFFTKRWSHGFQTHFKGIFCSARDFGAIFFVSRPNTKQKHIHNNVAHSIVKRLSVCDAFPKWKKKNKRQNETKSPIASLARHDEWTNTNQRAKRWQWSATVNASKINDRQTKNLQ